MTVTSEIDYNPFAPGFYTSDALDVYGRLRDEAPVYYSERWGWWALSRFEDVRPALMDPETFRSFEGMDIDDTGSDQKGPGSLPDMDNPRHGQLRKLVQPFFLPRRVAKLEEGIREVVRGYVASWKDRGEVDLAQDLGWPMPYDVFFHLVGLPDQGAEAREQLRRWVDALHGRVPGTPHLTREAAEATARMQEYYIDLLNDRRRNPRDDLFTDLVNAEIDGVPFVQGEITPASEISGLMMLLFLAGVDSTAGLIASLFKALAENPEQRALLAQDPSLIPGAVEEALRFSPPIQLTARTAARDVTLHGVTIPEGARVVLVLGAANRDERQFPNPDQFDVTRGRFRHFGFGEGIHGCLGAPLARIEIRVAVEEALPALGEYALAGEPVFLPSSPNMYTWANLPVSFPVRTSS